jgi:hypothetical protein
MNELKLSTTILLMISVLQSEDPDWQIELKSKTHSFVA